jgi:FKBP-type peptidyl-prolyl cis-trans isomerase 2
MKWSLSLILIVALLVFGCVNQQVVAQNQTNITNMTKHEVVEFGDTVSVDYILRLENGTIVDTSMASVAKEAGIFNPAVDYTPLKFKVVENNGIIKGFTHGVIGMKINETKEIVVQPENGYGLYDPKKVYSIPLYYNKSKFEKVPRKKLEMQRIRIEKGNVIFTDMGMLAIKDFDNESVTLMYLLSPGKKFSFGGIPQEVVNVTNDTVYIKLDLEEGKQYIIGDNNQKKHVTVLRINETEAIVDENHKFAGKTLYFTVTLREID